jgi:hypothetical protein
LISLWTRTPLHFGPASSIFFLSLPEQHTRVTFTVPAYPIGLPESRPDSLPNPHLNALSEPYPITSMFIRPYMFIPDRISLPDSSPDWTFTYPTIHGLTQSNFLTRSFLGQTSAYPIVPDHLIRLPYPTGLPSDAHSVKPFCTV